MTTLLISQQRLTAGDTTASLDVIPLAHDNHEHIAYISRILRLPVPVLATLSTWRAAKTLSVYQTGEDIQH